VHAETLQPRRASHRITCSGRRYVREPDQIALCTSHCLTRRLTSPSLHPEVARGQ
jgi:hypothetical protein